MKPKKELSVILTPDTFLFFCREQSKCRSSPAYTPVCAQASCQSLNYSYGEGCTLLFSKKYTPFQDH